MSAEDLLSQTEPVALNRDEALARLHEIVEGIDQDETYSDTGWWETSKGVEFGEGVLARLASLVEDLTEPVSASEVERIAREIVLSCVPFISAWEFNHDVDGESLHEELRNALGISEEEWREGALK